jgi:hypothetical protein
MKWITRERPKIDRIACRWLITRFIDSSPEFLFVPADRVLLKAQATGATPFDVAGVKYTHVGADCSFAQRPSPAPLACPLPRQQRQRTNRVGG